MELHAKPCTIHGYRFTSHDDFHNDMRAPDWVMGAFAEDEAVCFTDDGFIVRTLEGDMQGQWGDWLIRGVEGEFYPCKDSVVRKKYNLVEAGQ